MSDRWIRRRLDAGQLEPGAYRVSEGAMGSRVVTLACPHCGYADVPANEVTPAGVIVCIFVCPSAACTYAGYLRLDGYACTESARSQRR